MDPIISFPEAAGYLILFVILQVPFESFKLYVWKQNILLSHVFLNYLNGFIQYEAFCNLFLLLSSLRFQIYHVVTRSSGSFILTDE